MLRGRLLLLASMSALAVAAPAVAGKKVPSAEQGSVPLVLEAPVGLEAPVTVERGQTAWREVMRPERNVRLLDEAPRRPRPNAEAVPAGSVLFGYRLGSGVAYCPGAEATGMITVQCFRDFNRDGRFEGGYVTDYHDLGSRYMAGSVHGLGAAGNMRYERVPWTEARPIAAQYVFVGFKGAVAQFRLMIEGASMDSLTPCAPAGPDGACDVAGLTLKVERVGEAARISLLSASPDRRIQINMYGLSLPGPGA